MKPYKRIVDAERQRMDLNTDPEAQCALCGRSPRDHQRFEPAHTAEEWTIYSNGVKRGVRATEVFNYDLEVAPQGTLQLLTKGGARLIGDLGSIRRAQDMDIVAWALVAQRNKEEEVRRGLIPAPKARTSS
jgi:hypothetical protein